ncbi:hypothetical protein QBB32_07870 [Streptomyces scabiei]
MSGVRSRQERPRRREQREDGHHRCDPALPADGGGVHVGTDGRASTFKITCGFKDLTTEEQAIFLELLATDDEGNVALYVTAKAELMDSLPPHRVSVTTRTGREGQGPALDGDHFPRLVRPRISLR